VRQLIKIGVIFLREKSGLGENMLRLLDELEGLRVNLFKTKIRLDNSGKNRAFKDLCREKRYLRCLKLKFEFTPP